MRWDADAVLEHVIIHRPWEINLWISINARPVGNRIPSGRLLPANCGQELEPLYLVSISNTKRWQKLTMRIGPKSTFSILVSWHNVCHLPGLVDWQGSLVLNLRTTTSQKYEAVPRRARS